MMICKFEIHFIALITCL